MEMKLGEQKMMKHNGKKKKENDLHQCLNIGGSYKASGITKNWRRKELLEINNCWEKMLHNNIKKQNKFAKQKKKR